MDVSQQKKQVRVPMSRPGYGTLGKRSPVCTNHFNVILANANDYFFQYSVAIYYEDGKPVEIKGIGRKVMDKIDDIYKAEMGGKAFAYDGEKALFTVGPLPETMSTFPVVLEHVSSDRTGGTSISGGNGSPSEEDRKRRKRVSRSKSFRVEISFAAKIPMKAISDALRGKESEDYLDAIRVLDIVLRQHAAKQGCLLVKQSFFHNDVQYLGGGVNGCRGFHSSFRPTQNGLSLNMDVSFTTIVRPGSLDQFLIDNQNARDRYHIDWLKAKRTLRNLRISVLPANTEWKISGLSEEKCKNQRFLLKRKTAEGDGKSKEIEMTVYDYFIQIRKIPLKYSGDLPCINVGKPKRPTYIPIELCSLLPLQRYTKALTIDQRSSLVEKSRQKPKDKMGIVTNALRRSNYDAEPILRTCGISINSKCMQVESRVLLAPKLKFEGMEEIPRNGRWNVSDKKFVDPCTLKSWVLVDFSALRDHDRDNFLNSLLNCAKVKGISIEPPKHVFMENKQHRRAPPTVRVEQMIDQMKSRLPECPTFVLCILADRKNSEIYGPWKKAALTEYGFRTQCLAPQRQPNNQYLSNLLLKINAKLGGLNHLVEVQPNIPVFIKKPTIIFGMDVCHGSPGQSELPSIAAVVSSTTWPSICSYRASVRSQSPKAEMIDSLKDGGIIKELLDDFMSCSRNVKPLQVIIFRDGVSESQFKQVLNIEFDQIQQAFKALDENWSPQFTVIVAQKNHHTKFFQPQSFNNVSPGTVIDTQVCHPLYYDFYMCAHAGIQGTSRPTHYHVLLDEIGFTPDELQQLVHSLSYVYQRSTTAISTVAPIRYAHLAASQFSQFLKYENQSSSHGSVTSAGTSPVPKLPALHESVRASMFFC